MSEKSSVQKLKDLEEVDNYPLPELLIPRISKIHGYSQKVATDLVREAKRMLYLGAKTDEWVTPSLKVDDAWHEMLMFTRFYKKFCEGLGRFMHHDPTPGPPDGGKAYKRTKENYQKAFGFAPDPKYWG
jgi:hypothetical protein